MSRISHLVEFWTSQKMSTKVLSTKKDRRYKKHRIVIDWLAELSLKTLLTSPAHFWLGTSFERRRKDKKVLNKPNFFIRELITRVVVFLWIVWEWDRPKIDLKQLSAMILSSPFLIPQKRFCGIVFVTAYGSIQKLLFRKKLCNI